MPTEFNSIWRKMRAAVKKSHGSPISVIHFTADGRKVIAQIWTTIGKQQIRTMWRIDGVEMSKHEAYKQLQTQRLFSQKELPFDW